VNFDLMRPTNKLKTEMNEKKIREKRRRKEEIVQRALK
jgi:hypothetical protein